MKIFISTLLLCFVFVVFQGSGAVARGHHKPLRVQHTHAPHHGLKSKAKLHKKHRVRVARFTTPRFEADICLFFCRAQQLSSPQVSSFGVPSPWKRMERKDAVTYQGNDVDVGPRPYAWCGWWMQTYTGMTSQVAHLNLNRAIEWAQVGRKTTPQVGAIVVWRHHVGKITGVAAGGRFLVMSGNSGGHRGARTVTEHARSVRGAVAFRMLY